MNSTKERRLADDRRQEEVGPPSGWRDRRRSTERRIPEISECDVSEAEWDFYFGPKNTVAKDEPNEATVFLVAVSSS
jgi:hypothetical protein